jgi:hypothetical protein
MSAWRRKESRLCRAFSLSAIQRIRTEGGQPPKAGDCNVSANGKELRSAYSADYYFYAPGQK